MRLAVYYKDEHIKKVEEVDESKDLAEAVENFNAKHCECGDFVEIREYDNDSVVAYLYRARNGNISNYQSQLAGIAGNVNDLHMEIRWVEDLIEKLEAANNG